MKDNLFFIRNNFSTIRFLEDLLLKAKTGELQDFVSMAITKNSKEKDKTISYHFCGQSECHVHLGLCQRLIHKINEYCSEAEKDSLETF